MVLLIRPVQPTFHTDPANVLKAMLTLGRSYRKQCVLPYLSGHRTTLAVDGTITCTKPWTHGEWYEPCKRSTLPSGYGPLWEKAVRMMLKYCLFPVARGTVTPLPSGHSTELTTSVPAYRRTEKELFLSSTVLGGVPGLLIHQGRHRECQ